VLEGLSQTEQFNEAYEEETVKRRDFLTSASVAAASTIAMPAIAQTAPEIRWRLQSAFPKTLDTVYTAGEEFSKYVAEATDGKFQIQVFAAGEIVGSFQTLDAVTNNTVEMSHTVSSYFVGKDPTFALGAIIPFGMNTRQMNAWLYEGGGNELLNEFYSKYNVFALPASSTGTQMGGWFRKEIKTVADLQGLKMRIAGLAGEVMTKLGVVPQQIPAGEIYPALERGTIDAAEWVGPYDDEKLGLQKVAPFYYYPGWWEGGTTHHYFINKAKWDELPKAYKTIIQSASESTNLKTQAKYDARNPGALRRLVGSGAQLRPYSQDIMDAAFKASNELYDGLSTSNADFKKVYDSYRAFRNEEYLWFQVAEFAFDNFMIRARSKT
jgi:TRAP-type mannitol/chloroaromatic compound transport system substrate-binding protein